MFPPFFTFQAGCHLTLACCLFLSPVLLSGAFISSTSVGWTPLSVQSGESVLFSLPFAGGSFSLFTFKQTHEGPGEDFLSVEAATDSTNAFWVGGSLAIPPEGVHAVPAATDLMADFLVQDWGTAWPSQPFGLGNLAFDIFAVDPQTPPGGDFYHLSPGFAYLGFKFTDQQGFLGVDPPLYYGWMKISTLGATSLTILEWAYNDAINQTIRVGLHNSWQHWLADQGIDPLAPDSYSADPDADGLNNLEEYAFGGLPFTPSPSARPLQAVSSGHLTLQFYRARSDVTYQVEVSSNLLHWQPLGPANPGAVGTIVTVTDSPNLLPGQPRFLRVHLSLP